MPVQNTSALSSGLGVTFAIMSTYRSDEWQALMLSAQGGDAKAYRALLQSLRPWLLSYFNRRLRGGDVEDLVQMTLLSLHEKRHTYNPQAAFMPWIAAVARHKLIDYVRWSGRRVQVELTEDLGLEDGLSNDLAQRDVAVLLAKLPKDQAQLISLHKLEGLTSEEVAARIGKNTSAVKVSIHRGLKKLQALVGVKSGEVSDD